MYSTPKAGVTPTSGGRASAGGDGFGSNWGEWEDEAQTRTDAASKQPSSGTPSPGGKAGLVDSPDGFTNEEAPIPSPMAPPKVSPVAPMASSPLVTSAVAVSVGGEKRAPLATSTPAKKQTTQGKSQVS